MQEENLRKQEESVQKQESMRRGQLTEYITCFTLAKALCEGVVIYYTTLDTALYIQHK